MISLDHIDDLNRAAVLALTVAADQRGQVSSNERSLHQAAQEDYLLPLAIICSGQVVGFVMYGLAPEDGEYWLYRMMIDEKFQRRGYGLAAIQAVVERLSKTTPCRRILLDVKPDNVSAIRLYGRAGFVDTGERLDGEMVMALPVSPQS